MQVHFREKNEGAFDVWVYVHFDYTTYTTFKNNDSYIYLFLIFIIFNQ